jgi:hypothetical protein
MIAFIGRHWVLLIAVIALAALAFVYKEELKRLKAAACDFIRKRLPDIFVVLIVSAVTLLLVASLTSPAVAGNLVKGLEWTAPTTNSDGSPLDDLAGHKVYYGKQSGTYDGQVDVGLVTTVTMVEVLPAPTDGLYCFAVTAYNIFGRESGYSNEVCVKAWKSRFFVDTGVVPADPGTSLKPLTQ